MKNNRRADETVDYKLFKIRMVGSYRNTSESSNDIDSFFPSTFLGISRSLMAYSSSKYLGVEEYEITFTTQENVDLFYKGFNMSRTGDEANVILEPRFEVEWANMVVHAGTFDEFVYLHFPVIHELGVLTPFTLFVFKALETMNVSPHKYHPTGRH